MYAVNFCKGLRAAASLMVHACHAIIVGPVSTCVNLVADAWQVKARDQDTPSLSSLMTHEVLSATPPQPRWACKAGLGRASTGTTRAHCQCWLAVVFELPISKLCKGVHGYARKVPTCCGKNDDVDNGVAASMSAHTSIILVERAKAF